MNSLFQLPGKGNVWAGTNAQTPTQVMMKGGPMGEDDAEAALSSLKMEGRYTVEAWS